MAMSYGYETPSSIIPGLDNLSLNGHYDSDYLSSNEGPAGPPPPPPPPPGPTGSSGEGQKGQSGAGPPPPPPPPPAPGFGSMATYKQQKDQEDAASGKDLTAKLAGGKKSDAKPFNYGITADQLKTPSQIKRENYEKGLAAGGGGSGAASPARPSTPSFGDRRPSADISSNGGGLASLRSSLAEKLAKPSSSFPNNSNDASEYGLNGLSTTPKQSSFRAPSPTPPAPTRYSSANAAPPVAPTYNTPTYSPPAPPAVASYSTPPAPPTPQAAFNSAPLTLSAPLTSTSYQSYGFSPKQASNEHFSTPSPTPQFQTIRRPSYGTPKTSTGPTSWSNARSDDEGASPDSGGNYFQSAYSPQRTVRSRSNSLSGSDRQTPGGITQAAQLMDQIRSNYNSSPSSPYQQLFPSSGRISPLLTNKSAQGNSSAGVPPSPRSSSYQQPQPSNTSYQPQPSSNTSQQQPQRPQQQPSQPAQQTYYYGQPTASFGIQNSPPSRGGQPQQQPQQQSQQQPTYHPATPNYTQQSQSPTPTYSFGQNYGQTAQPQQHATTPANKQSPYIIANYQRSPSTEPSVHRTLPFNSYVTPTDIDFSDPYPALSYTNSKTNYQQQSQQQPSFTSTFRTEMQMPSAHRGMQQTSPSSNSNWNNGSIFNGNPSPMQPSGQGNTRVVPIQIQYDSRPSSNQHWQTSGTSDF